MKNENVPDYKSKSQVRRITAQKGQPFEEFLAEQMRDPEFAEAYKSTDIEVEHQRLQLAVLEAVKEERRMEQLTTEGQNTTVRTDAHIESYGAAKVKREAVDALIAFEAENKIGENNE